MFWILHGALCHFIERSVALSKFATEFRQKNGGHFFAKLEMDIQNEGAGHTSNLHNCAPYYTHILLKNQKNRADTGSILYCNNSPTRYFFVCQVPPRLLPIRMISPFPFNNWSENSVALTDTPSAWLKLLRLRLGLFQQSAIFFWISSVFFPG